MVNGCSSCCWPVSCSGAGSSAFARMTLLVVSPVFMSGTVSGCASTTDFGCCLRSFGCRSRIAMYSVYSPAGSSSARPSSVTSPVVVTLFSVRKYTSANGQLVSTPLAGAGGRRGARFGLAYGTHIHRDRIGAERAAADLQHVRDVDVLARLEEVILELELHVGGGRLLAGRHGVDELGQREILPLLVVAQLSLLLVQEPVSCLARMRERQRRRRGPVRRRLRKRDGSSSRKLL